MIRRTRLHRRISPVPISPVSRNDFSVSNLRLVISYKGDLRECAKEHVTSVVKARKSNSAMSCKTVHMYDWEREDEGETFVILSMEKVFSSKRANVFDYGSVEATVYKMKTQKEWVSMIQWIEGESAIRRSLRPKVLDEYDEQMEWIESGAKLLPYTLHEDVLECIARHCTQATMYLLCWTSREMRKRVKPMLDNITLYLLHSAKGEERATVSPWFSSQMECVIPRLYPMVKDTQLTKLWILCNSFFSLNKSTLMEDTVRKVASRLKVDDVVAWVINTKLQRGQTRRK